MKSRTTTEFGKLLAELPKTIQAQTRKAYRQLKQDPNYLSLRFKKAHPTLPIYAARPTEIIAPLVNLRRTLQSSSGLDLMQNTIFC